MIDKLKLALRECVEDCSLILPEDRPALWKERKRVKALIAFYEWVAENGLESEL